LNVPLLSLFMFTKKHSYFYWICICSSISLRRDVGFTDEHIFL
jgi:hypothetical protein